MIRPPSGRFSDAVCLHVRKMDPVDTYHKKFHLAVQPGTTANLQNLKCVLFMETALGDTNYKVTWI